ncbi:MAG: putative hydrolase of the HAD superfamily, partial [Kiritimatiellia bacterium]
WVREYPDTAVSLGIDRVAWNELLLDRSPERLSGALTDPVEIMRSLVHHFDAAVPLSRIEEVTAIRIRRFERALAIIPPETVDQLTRLKSHGVKIGLISNADVAETTGWAQSPIAHLFDTVVFSCEVGLVKPDPAIYRVGLERLGVEAHEALFVGDGGSSEHIGARNAGLTPVLYTGITRHSWPERIERCRGQVDHLIQDFSQLYGE